jgi:hypothetical protein
MPVYSADKENALLSLNEGAGDKDKSDSKSAAWASSGVREKSRARDESSVDDSETTSENSPVKASAPAMVRISNSAYILLLTETILVDGFVIP